MTFRPFLRLRFPRVFGRFGLGFRWCLAFSHPLPTRSIFVFVQARLCDGCSPAKKVPHLVLISFFRFRHFFIMRDLVFIMSDLVYKISNVLNLPRFGSPPISFWPHFAGGQHFHKPCLTPHVVVFIVNKCSSSHGFQSLSGGRRHGR